MLIDNIGEDQDLKTENPKITTDDSKVDVSEIEEQSTINKYCQDIIQILQETYEPKELIAKLDLIPVYYASKIIDNLCKDESISEEIQQSIGYALTQYGPDDKDAFLYVITMFLLIDIEMLSRILSNEITDEEYQKIMSFIDSNPAIVARVSMLFIRYNNNNSCDIELCRKMMSFYLNFVNQLDPNKTSVADLKKNALEVYKSQDSDKKDKLTSIFNIYDVKQRFIGFLDALMVNYPVDLADYIAKDVDYFIENFVRHFSKANSMKLLVSIAPYISDNDLMLKLSTALKVLDILKLKNKMTVEDGIIDHMIKSINDKSLDSEKKMKIIMENTNYTFALQSDGLKGINSIINTPRTTATKRDENIKYINSKITKIKEKREKKRLIDSNLSFSLLGVSTINYKDQIKDWIKKQTNNS
jgi:hypothetical protein